MMDVNVALFRTVIIILFFSQISAQCDYEPLNSSQIFSGIRIEPTLLNTKSQRYAYSNIRIHFDYDMDFDYLPGADRIRNEVMEPAKERLQSIITVRNPLNGILKVDRPCESNSYVYNELNEKVCTNGCSHPTICVDISVPLRYLKNCHERIDGFDRRTGSQGSGILGIDIVLLVVVRYCTGGTIATAASCFLEAELDRPIFGKLRLCTGLWEGGKNVLNRRQAVQHEIMHALGFAPDKFQFFRDSSVYPVVPRDRHNKPSRKYYDTKGQFIWTDRIVKEFKRERSSINKSYIRRIYGLTLRTLLDTVRAHFRCPTLDGVDLDDVKFHFNEYAFHNEMMTPIIDTGITPLSVFTLAFLRDTGWYDADFGKADHYIYGKGKGCGIILDGCYKYMNDQLLSNQPIHPFCNQPLKYGNVLKCSDDRRSFGFCSMDKYKSLRKKFHYFRHIDGVPDNETHLYGGLQKSEFCPRFQLLSGSRSMCLDSYSIQERDNDVILQSYRGSDSACIENAIEGSPTNKYYGASCQRFSFSKKTEILTIYFEEKTINCPSKGPITFTTKDNYKVIFTCPTMADFKEDLNWKDDYSYKIRISRLLMLLCILSFWLIMCNA